MIYLSAFLFGVAVWMSNPIAAGAMTVLGVLTVAMWLNDRIIQIVDNQKFIAKEIRRNRR